MSYTSHWDPADITMMDRLNSDIHLCPAHSAWRLLSDRERQIWNTGYAWGQRDAESDMLFAGDSAATRVGKRTPDDAPNLTVMMIPAYAWAEGWNAAIEAVKAML